MKLNQVFSRSGRRLLLRPPESEQTAGQDKEHALTPEQTAEALAKRGILMRTPSASALGVGRRSS